MEQVTTSLTYLTVQVQVSQFPVGTVLINLSVRDSNCRQICMGGREEVQTALQRTSAEVGFKE